MGSKLRQGALLHADPTSHTHLLSLLLPAIFIYPKAQFLKGAKTNILQMKKETDNEIVVYQAGGPIC